MTPASPRIGVLGGTFDPVHNAHIALAREMTGRLGLTELRLLPAGSPWQKTHVGASTAQRLDMLKIAVSETGLSATIDERELNRAGPSYTVDSLRELRGELGAGALIVLLIGADQLLGLQSWHRWQEIFQYANLAMVGRVAFELETHPLDRRVADAVRGRQIPSVSLPEGLDAPAGQVVLIPANLGTTSSSLVRNRLAVGDVDGIRDLVPSQVLDYIRAHHLYTA